MAYPRMTIVSFRVRTKTKNYTRKGKIMLQEIDATIAPTVSIKPCAGESGKHSTDKSSADEIRLFALIDQVSVESSPSGVDAERLADIDGLTFGRRRQPRLIDPLEDPLYVLIAAVTLGYLVIVFLGF
jgi:hypothetical protein